MSFVYFVVFYVITLTDLDGRRFISMVFIIIIIMLIGDHCGGVCFFCHVCRWGACVVVQKPAYKVTHLKTHNLTGDIMVTETKSCPDLPKFGKICPVWHHDMAEMFLFLSEFQFSTNILSQKG